MASHEGIRLKDVIESQTERLVRRTLGDSDADLNNVVIACEFAAENFRLVPHLTSIPTVVCGDDGVSARPLCVFG
jgi:hypothetical protein